MYTSATRMEGGQKGKQIGGVYSTQTWSSRIKSAIRVYGRIEEYQVHCLSQERDRN